MNANQDTFSPPEIPVETPHASGFSYWEIKQFFNTPDFVVVGAGIVGLSCALSLRRRFPKASVLVLERGLMPQGASTKNAGFACFGSISELLDDMNTMTEEELLALVEKRYKGIRLLRSTLGDKAIGYKSHGGYEIFLKGDPDFFMACLEHRKRINKLLKPVLGKKVFEVVRNDFGFEGIQDHLMHNRYEGQIDTGKMMQALYHKCVKKGVKILYGAHLESYSQGNGKVALKTNIREFECGKLLLATNAFAGEVMGEAVAPARAQVLVTEPIKNLPFKGTFHMDRGYYYFRNVNGRILFGGGRNLDVTGEETTEFGTTALIQDKLEELLQNVLLPGTPVRIDARWSGIMGVGDSKSPVIRLLSDNVACGVRLGGMGVAIGSHTGKELSHLF